MKVVEKTGKTSKAWKKPIPEIKFPYSYKAYETIEEVRAANDTPSDEKIVKLLNAERDANARGKAQTQAWIDAGYVKPTLENDVQLRLKTIFDALMSAKLYDEATCRKMAAQNLGLTEWPSDDEDDE